MYLFYSSESPPRHAAKWIHTLLACLPLLATLVSTQAGAAAKPRLNLSKVVWSSTAETLTVSGSYTHGQTSQVDLYDNAGRLLASPVLDAKHKFRVTLSNPAQPELLCAIRAEADAAKATKAVAGSAGACAKTPVCKIQTPSGLYATQINVDVSFAATAVLKDRKAAPLRVEWDFAGGSMGEPMAGTHPIAYKRPDTQQTTVQFVRDKAYYRVRFTAWDKLNRYCEDSVMVKVGNPPTDLPPDAGLAQTSQQSSPASGSQLAGHKNDLVVMPFADLTMPGTGDYRLSPNVEQVTADGAFSNLNALVYRKDRLPLVLESGKATVTYTAASNSQDPVGEASINSTSQNWPLNAEIYKAAPLATSSIQKTDFWEIYTRASGELIPDGYTSRNWPTVNPQISARVIGPDEGLVVGSVPGDANVTAETSGRYMPGRSAPYVENVAQPFTSYDPQEKKFLARAIPLTDIDDAGRINPVPLLRVEAVDQELGNSAASDAVVAAGRDMHCRECHAKGKIGADDGIDWNALQPAFHSSNFYGNRSCWFPEPYCSLSFATPEFADAASASLFDQELAANRNIETLHAFYDNTGEVGMANGWYSVMWSGLEGVTQDQPNSCNWCHRSRISAQMGQALVNFPHYQWGSDPTPSNATLSEVMHNWHAQLQLDPADPGRILRNSSGRPKLWDPAQGTNPNTLFPTVDADGNALPMEQSCLRCHAGHRDQLYRDRMYSAGVTCYDCHGDMSAVGAAHEKPRVGPDGYAKRINWYEQPDCGSCHTGNGNRGADGKNGYYSAGVKQRAFDDRGPAADPSATSRPPLSPRFAVLPASPVTMQVVDYEVSSSNKFAGIDYWQQLTLPLYRQSRDSHGNVPCAACHGGAHENWPNRDPKANDNVTAMQLQGHAGHILECNVCHTADSFKELRDLDGGKYMTEVADMKDFVGGGSGVLGGPHNLHPVNDPNWWRETTGNTLDVDNTGTSGAYGGWHNDMAKQPGKGQEDQCAACHGNDHRGTRLSKTPVDRVFDFSGPDFKRLKKAGFSKKVVKVAAGTVIGCNTCHSIKTSCIGSPAGDACGTTSDFVPAPAVNHDPVITTLPSLEAVIGQPYTYDVDATDEDGDTLSYSLATWPWFDGAGAMKIGADGVVSYSWPEGLFSAYNFGPLTYPYIVRVSDGKGGYATQTIKVTLGCPAGQAWLNPGWSGHCVTNSVGAAITSMPGVRGLDANESFSYSVTATSDQGLPLTFSLLGAPDGMTISDTSGAIQWTAPAKGGLFAFTIKAADTGGGVAYQTVSLTVCAPPEVWHSGHGMCMAP